MNFRILIATSLLLLVACGNKAQIDPTPQNHEAFNLALNDGSSAPYYVRFVVLDNSTGRSYVTCKTANILRGAIHIEKGLPFDEEGSAITVEYVSSNLSHTFAFSNTEALKYMQSSFNSRELALVSKELRNLSNEQIVMEMKLDGSIFKLYRPSRSAALRFKMDAVACALIERGLSPRSADMIAALRL